jgi:hypothetical protein
MAVTEDWVTAVNSTEILRSAVFLERDTKDDSSKTNVQMVIIPNWENIS